MGGPSLDLDWELGLFKAMRALWRGIAGAPAPAFDRDRAATLEPLARRLQVLASLVAGRPLRVLPARGPGGLRGEDLLLPEYIDLAPDPEANAALYVLRAVLAGQLVTQPSGPPLEAQVAQAVVALSAELPGFGPAWTEAVALQEKLGQNVLWGPILEVLESPATGAEDDAPPAAGTHSAEAAPVQDLKIHSLDEEDALSLPIHAFEKVETAEAFTGTLRQLDGEDDLDDHLEALDEVQLGDLIRGGPQAHSLLRADIALDADIPDVADIGPQEAGQRYDEWDGKAGRYKPAWCTVYPTKLPPGDDAWAMEALSRHRRTTDRLQAELQRHRDQLRAAPRQLDGEDVDIDALTDAWASHRAGHEPDPRLYLRQQRQRRDVATLVLLDISLSSDAWVQNRRVLDVARESVLILGEVADRLGDRLSVLAFASHTRHKVRAWEVLGWDEPWRKGRGRLGRLSPQGYTRIGPVLRHGIAELSKVPAKDRLLLLISDGKPTDYDRYEGRYGMADVRQALRESTRAGVRVHALAIDDVARDTLPAMLGPGAWDVLRQPEALPTALTRAYGRLTG